MENPTTIGLDLSNNVSECEQNRKGVVQRESYDDRHRPVQERLRDCRRAPGAHLPEEAPEPAPDGRVLLAVPERDGSDGSVRVVALLGPRAPETRARRAAPAATACQAVRAREQDRSPGR